MNMLKSRKFKVALLLGLLNATQLQAAQKQANNNRSRDFYRGSELGQGNNALSLKKRIVHLLCYSCSWCSNNI